MSSRSTFFTILETMLCIFAGVILISNLTRLTTGHTDYMTFEGLLQMLQNSSSMQSVSHFIDLNIRGNWGIFDFLRIYINSITGVFTFALWLAENLMNAIVFSLSFIFQLFWI